MQSNAMIATSPIRTNKQRNLKYLRSYLFILPSFAFIATFMYTPAFSALYHSFTDWDLATAPWVGLDNYFRFFQSESMRIAIFNQLVFSIFDITKGIVFALIAAELMYLLPGKKWMYVFRTGFIIPILVPGTVGLMLWLSIYDPVNGLLNQLLMVVGLDSWTHAWLSEENTAMAAIILMGFPFVSGLNFLIFYAAIGNLNMEIIEAARMDGAKGWTVFRKIHLPLLIPSIKILIILGIIGSLQDYVRILILTEGGPGTATIIPALTMYTAAFTSSEYGFACAIGTVLFLVIIALTLFNLKFMKTDY